MVEIKDLLLRIAKLYSIPNFDAESSVLLAEDTIERYSHHSLDLIMDSLRNPPIGKERIYRLSPDTLAEWIETIRQRKIIEHNQKESEIKTKEPYEYHKPTESVEKLISGVLNNLLDKEEPKGERPPVGKSVGVIAFGTKEYYEQKELHLQWIRECTDKYTGKLLPGALEEKEWLESRSSL